MKGFINNIEQITRENGDYRRVLYTARHSQLVLMSLRPGEEIGEEAHKESDQFFRCETGIGKIIIDGTAHDIRDGSAVIIPVGARHNVINTSPTENLKLYTIYSPAHHKEGTVHHTKADEVEESFDGVTTE